MGENKKPSNVISIDGDKNTEMVYTYFVHYSHSRGFAWLELNSSDVIKSAQHVVELQNYIAHTTPHMLPVISNWILLKKEKGEVKAQ